MTKIRREEGGSSTVEFVLILPAYIWLLVMSIETGIITVRHALLEGGLDIAVRKVRLSTTKVPDYEEIRALVCANARFIQDCEKNLRLEMVKTDIRNYTPMGSQILCENAAEPTGKGDNDDNFDNSGQPNELMQIRACYKYNPLFPNGFLGSALKKDVNGQAAIVTMSAFVQEPL
jgi:hypothetical protein